MKTGEAWKKSLIFLLALFLQMALGDELNKYQLWSGCHRRGLYVYGK